MQLRFLVVLLTAGLASAATPQERAIKRLEKAQHAVLKANAESERRGMEAEAACRMIGRVLSTSPLLVFACVLPAPQQAAQPRPAPRPNATSQEEVNAAATANAAKAKAAEESSGK